MVDEVKICVDAKVNFFAEYFTVPTDLQSEVDRFAADVTALGETCANAAEFEDQFIKTGLSARFNGLLPKCAAKAHKMTKEEKQHSRKVAKDILQENKKELVGDAVFDIAGYATTYTREELITQSREKMIEDGTLADYTIAKNTVEDIGRLGSFLKNKFGRRGNK